MYIYSAAFYKNSQKCIRGERKYKESNCIRGSKGCMSDIRELYRLIVCAHVYFDL